MEHDEKVVSVRKKKINNRPLEKMKKSSRPPNARRIYRASMWCNGNTPKNIK